MLETILEFGTHLPGWSWFALLGLLCAFGIWWFLLRSRRLAPSQWSPDSRFIQVGEFSLHYIIEGKGPFLLLLHGIGAQIFSWRRLIPLLAKNYTVIAVDLPGFGRSSKIPSLAYGLDEQCERLETFLQALGIEQTRIIGSSMGGAIALELAQRNSKKILGIVCISPATSRFLLPAKAHRLSSIARVLQYLITPHFVAQILKKVVRRHELITEESIVQYSTPYHRQPDSIRTFLLASQLLTDSRVETNPGQVTTPVLYLWGEQDKIISVKFLKRLKKQWGSKIQAATHPQGGHHLMEDEPEWVTEKCRKFFSQHD